MGHADNGEVFVEFVKGGRAAAAARGYNGSATFMLLLNGVLKKSLSKKLIKLPLAEA